MVNCGIWDMCIVGLVRLDYVSSIYSGLITADYVPTVTSHNQTNRHDVIIDSMDNKMFIQGEPDFIG